MKKQTLLGWDLVEAAGLSEQTAKQTRTLTLLNTSGSGGARVYDMYVRVPYKATDGISTVTTSARQGTQKVILDGRLVIVKDGQCYSALGQKVTL